VLFTAFGNQIFTLDPTHAMTTLPLVVFRDALTPYKDLQQEAWGAALLLVVMVLVINLGSRWVLRRQIRLARQL
jgi:phosphate transport system permease protein